MSHAARLHHARESDNVVRLLALGGGSVDHGGRMCVFHSPAGSCDGLVAISGGHGWQLRQGARRSHIRYAPHLARQRFKGRRLVTKSTTRR